MNIRIVSIALLVTLLSVCMSLNADAALWRGHRHGWYGHHGVHVYAPVPMPVPHVVGGYYGGYRGRRHRQYYYEPKCYGHGCYERRHHYDRHGRW